MASFVVVQALGVGLVPVVKSTPTRAALVAWPLLHLLSCATHWAWTLYLWCLHIPPLCLIWESLSMLEITDNRATWTDLSTCMALRVKIHGHMLAARCFEPLGE